MGDWPSISRPATPLTLSIMSVYGCGWETRLTAATTTPVAATWTANLVAYMPLSLPFPYVVRRFVWENGSTTTTSNVDMGVYSMGGERLVNTGSVVMGSANALQYAALGTPYPLSAGIYYLAWTCDNTTNRANCLAGTAIRMELAGLVQETTGGFGLPATMTPVAWAQAFGPPICGITRTTTGF